MHENSRSAHALMERGSGYAQLTGKGGLRGALLDQAQESGSEPLTGIGVVPLEADAGLPNGSSLGCAQVASGSSHARDDTSGNALTQAVQSVRMKPDRKGMEMNWRLEQLEIAERQVEELSERQVAKTDTYARDHEGEPWLGGGSPSESGWGRG